MFGSIVGDDVLVPWTATKEETIVAAAENIDIANFFKVGSHIAKKTLWQPKPLLAVGTGRTSGIHTGHKIFGSQNQLWQNSAKDLWHCQLLFLIFFLPSILFCNQQETCTDTPHNPHSTPTQNKCYHRRPSPQSTGEKLIGLPFTI
jgi:hypothetical protein